MIQSGIDVVLLIDDKPVGGQTDAILNRSMTPIDITNKIKGDWAENLAGLRTWRIACNGLYVVDDESLNALEEAFMRNSEIMVKIKLNNKNYFGRALIVDYPLLSKYNAQFKYNLTLLGSGELHIGNN